VIKRASADPDSSDPFFFLNPALISVLSSATAIDIHEADQHAT
jgi:hypothetical protein